MSHIKETRGLLENLEDISDSLRNQGFTDNEITSAYSWVLDQLQTESQLLHGISHPGSSFRVFSDKERQHFSRETQGYLMQLRHLGLLTDAQMETVLERGALVGPAPINLDQIKIIIGTVLFRDSGRPELIRQPSYFLNDDEGSIN
jgi:Smg protein